jgi:hypothetical protein
MYRNRKVCRADRAEIAIELLESFQAEVTDLRPSIME